MASWIFRCCELMLPGRHSGQSLLRCVCADSPICQATNRHQLPVSRRARTSLHPPSRLPSPRPVETAPKAGRPHITMIPPRIAWPTVRRAGVAQCRAFTQFPAGHVRPVAGIPMPYITEVTVRCSHPWCKPLPANKSPGRGLADMYVNSTYASSPVLGTDRNPKPTSSLNYFRSAIGTSSDMQLIPDLSRNG